MNTRIYEARKYIAKAREALQRGDNESAWQWGKQAALAAPEMEDGWLVLTASDPNPQDALAYAQKALEINPESIRARRGLEWALARVKQTEARNGLVRQGSSLSLSVGRKDTLASLSKRANRGTPQKPGIETSRGNWLYFALLIGAGCLIFGLAVFFAVTNPALASIVSNVDAPVSTQENNWAPVDIAKPTITPVEGSVLASELSDATPSVPTDLPTLAATETLTVTPEATETPGTIVMEIVEDNSISQSVPPDEAQAQYPVEGNGERWIDVNLSEQRLYAYEGDVVVKSFLVSTGVAATPTVTGKYKIWIKVRVQDMSGPGYYLRDVPYVMFFYKDYGLHGTYWHKNFGTPMSRGCVNLTIDDAAWLYNWASVGTVVNVHY
ncbi:MAG TPA: L,D-transpeptidase family protein [Anaerolineales bacterium]